jgi:hypothetical protein
MATFLVVLHLITVCNYGSAMVLVDMLRAKLTCSDSQDRLLASPIVHARTNASFKVIKTIGIPHHDCSPTNFFNQLCGHMTIFTNPWIFYYSEWSIRSSVDVPQCNSQFLAMIMKKPFFLLPHHAAQTLYVT